MKLLDTSEPGVQVVAETADVTAAVDAAALLHPDVVIANLRLPGERSLLTALREVDPDVPVIGLVDDPGAEAEVRAWAADGVRGLVPRDVDATSLGRAVLAAARGEVLVFGGLLEQLSLAPTGTSLTQRESEVRILLEQGLADKQIATRLGISVKTVEKHVGAVLRKENVRSRTELVALRF